MSTLKANYILDNAGGNTAQINGITPTLSSLEDALCRIDNTTLMTPLRTDQAATAVAAALAIVLG